MDGQTCKMGVLSKQCAHDVPSCGRASPPDAADGADSVLPPSKYWPARQVATPATAPIKRDWLLEDMGAEQREREVSGQTEVERERECQKVPRRDVQLKL